MFFDWFNTKEASAIGLKLAENLSAELTKNHNKSLKIDSEFKSKIMQKFLYQINQYKQTNNLNFYKKSKLANEFKWRLLELGHPKDLVEKLTKELVLHIS